MMRQRDQKCWRGWKMHNKEAEENDPEKNMFEDQINKVASAVVLIPQVDFECKNHTVKAIELTKIHM